MTIGEAIRKAMYDKRISAREAARRTGLSNSMVSQYAREKIHPTFNAAAKLALLLDFSLDEVASYLSQPPKEKRNE